MEEESMRAKCSSSFEKFRQSNKLAVFIVYATLMIDNMLLTAIVPILPEYFFHEELKEVATSHSPFTTRLLTTTQPETTSNPVTNGTNVTGYYNVECEESEYKEVLSSENLYLAFLIASKPLVQVFANMAVGPITDKVGYDVPMFVGYIVLIASSLVFAFGESYAVLFFARAMQGIGSACCSTAGMGMLADRFRDDVERGQMIGLALGGLAMGVLVGPPFASLTYQFSSKETPFLVLAGASFIIGLLQFSTRQLHLASNPHSHLGSSIVKLLKDPYILLTSFALMLGNMPIGVLETGQPIWMMTTMCAKKWMLGIAFIPESISYLISALFFAWMSHRCGRWLICLSSFYVSAIGCVTLPLCKSLYELFGPGFVLGTAVGMVDSTVFPIMGNLVDTRHTSLYGSVYAIADISFCAAFIIGPLLAGTVIHTIGFNWLMAIIAILNFCFAPLVCFLRNPPATSEEARSILLDKSTEREYSSIYDAELSSVGRIIDKDPPP